MTIRPEWTWQRSAIVLLLLYTACLVVLGPSVQFSQWYIGPDNNQAAAEAQSWLAGRLDLPSRGGDVALYHDHFYNIFPPLWTMICFLVYGCNQLLFGEPLVFYTPIYNLILAGPVPILFFLAFRRCGAGVISAAALAFYAIAGTCLWPVAAMLGGIRTAWIYSIQHILAQVGLAVVVMGLFGRPRFWLAGLGVLIAAWSRQTCLLLALPVLWLAWRQPSRRRALIQAAIPLALAVCVPAALNLAKFDSPFETGYRFIFSGTGSHQDYIRGPDGSLDLFALRYLPRHAYEMFLAPPRIYLSHQGLQITGFGPRTALWFGSPLLLFVLFDWRQWWSEPTRRVLILATLPIILTDLLWHGPIEGSPGYYRYTLDFSLIWLAVIAPSVVGPSRRWIFLPALAWSVFYFYMINNP